jgi:hypothetical protein
MSTIIKFLIASLMVVYTANASEWRLNLNNPSGHNSFRYSNSSIFKPGHRPNHRTNHRPQQPIHKQGTNLVTNQFTSPDMDGMEPLIIYPDIIHSDADTMDMVLMAVEVHQTTKTS